MLLDDSSASSTQKEPSLNDFYSLLTKLSRRMSKLEQEREASVETSDTASSSAAAKRSKRSSDTHSDTVKKEILDLYVTSLP